MSFLVRRCRDVSALVLAAEDRRLSLRERLAVRLHLAMCDACTRFSSQVRLMRSAMPLWRRYRESDPQDRPPPL
jgi:Putative zinc-finger